MNIYIGNYWVPFPSSEYGGSWVVVAENEGQCIDLLRGLCYYGDEYAVEIAEAVSKSTVLELKDNTAAPRVIDYFFT